MGNKWIYRNNKYVYLECDNKYEKSSETQAQHTRQLCNYDFIS